MEQVNKLEYGIIIPTVDENYANPLNLPVIGYVWSQIENAYGTYGSDYSNSDAQGIVVAYPYGGNSIKLLVSAESNLTYNSQTCTYVYEVTFVPSTESGKWVRGTAYLLSDYLNNLSFLSGCNALTIIQNSTGETTSPFLSLVPNYNVYLAESTVQLSSSVSAEDKSSWKTYLESLAGQYNFYYWTYTFEPGNPYGIRTTTLVNSSAIELNPVDKTQQLFNYNLTITPDNDQTSLSEVTIEFTDYDGISFNEGWESSSKPELIAINRFVDKSVLETTYLTKDLVDIPWGGEKANKLVLKDLGIGTSTEARNYSIYIAANTLSLLEDSDNATSNTVIVIVYNLQATSAEEDEIAEYDIEYDQKLSYLKLKPTNFNIYGVANNKLLINGDSITSSSIVNVDENYIEYNGLTSYGSDNVDEGEVRTYEITIPANTFVITNANLLLALDLTFTVTITGTKEVTSGEDTKNPDSGDSESGGDNSDNSSGGGENSGDNNNSSGGGNSGEDSNTPETGDTNVSKYDGTLFTIDGYIDDKLSIINNTMIIGANLSETTKVTLNRIIVDDDSNAIWSDSEKGYVKAWFSYSYYDSNFKYVTKTSAFLNITKDNYAVTLSLPTNWRYVTVTLTMLYDGGTITDTYDMYRVSSKLYELYIGGTKSINKKIDSETMEEIIDTVVLAEPSELWDIIQTSIYDGTTYYKAKIPSITKVRLGNLSGIYNEKFGTKQPYGYGLYGDNAYLTGNFYLNNGKSLLDVSNTITMAVGDTSRVESNISDLNDRLKSLTNEVYSNVDSSVTEQLTDLKTAMTATISNAISNNLDAVMRLGGDYALMALGSAGLSIINPDVKYNDDGLVDETTIGDGDEYILMLGDSVKIATYSKGSNGEYEVIYTTVSPKDWKYVKGGSTPMLDGNPVTFDTTTVAGFSATVGSTTALRYVTYENLLYSFSSWREGTLKGEAIYYVPKVSYTALFEDGKISANLIEVDTAVANSVIATVENNYDGDKDNPLRLKDFDLPYVLINGSTGMLKANMMFLSGTNYFSNSSNLPVFITDQGEILLGLVIGNDKIPTINIRIGLEGTHDFNQEAITLNNDQNANEGKYCYSAVASITLTATRSKNSSGNYEYTLNTDGWTPNNNYSYYIDFGEYFRLYYYSDEQKLKIFANTGYTYEHTWFENKVITAGSLVTILYPPSSSFIEFEFNYTDGRYLSLLIDGNYSEYSSEAFTKDELQSFSYKTSYESYYKEDYSTSPNKDSLNPVDTMDLTTAFNKTSVTNVLDCTTTDFYSESSLTIGSFDTILYLLTLFKDTDTNDTVTTTMSYYVSNIYGPNSVIVSQFKFADNYMNITPSKISYGGKEILKMTTSS